MRFAKQLRDLIRSICAGDESTRLVFVPVDDPDLAEQDLGAIIGDLQVLGSIPGIIPIVCFSTDDLFSSWPAPAAHATRSPMELRVLRARQFEKAFPQRCRFELEPIAPPYRGSFSPIGVSRSLKELLGVVRRRVELSAAPYFPIDETFAATEPRYGIGSPLPDNPRTLIQLWESLNALPRHDSDALTLTMRRLVDSISERIVLRLNLPLNRIMLVSPTAGQDHPPRIELALPQYEVVAAARGNFHPPHNRVASVRLRELSRISIDLTRADMDDSAVESPKRLTPEDAASLLGTIELAADSGLYSYEHDRDSMYRVEAWFLQQVILAGQPTDNGFICLPRAVSISQMWDAAELWKELVNVSDSADVVPLLVAAVRAACAFAMPGGAEADPSDYQRIVAHAGEVYRKCLASSGSRCEAFVEWYIFDLPRQWHDAFLTADQIREVFAQTEHTITKHSPWDRGFFTRAESLQRRLGPLLDAMDDTESPLRRHTWLAGYFDYAAALESPLAPRLGALYSAWTRDAASFRAGNVVSSALRPSKKRTKAKPAPYATPESSELLAAGLTAVRRLVAAAQSEHAR